MPSTRKITAPVVLDIPPAEFRQEDLAEYSVTFATFREDADPAPFFVGLPDDRCQCPHWGFVTSGQVTFRWPDHEETYVEGDAFYAPPGHLPLVTAGSTVVEFSPASELRRTNEVLEGNLAAEGSPG